MRRMGLLSLETAMVTWKSFLRESKDKTKETALV